MKNNKTKFLNLASVSILISFLASSCTEDPSQEVAITTRKFDLETYEGRLAYTDYHLKVLAKAIGKVANKEEFKSALYTNVESYENSVLLEGLANSDNGENSTLRTDFATNALSNSENFNQALNAFKEVSELPLYPQIYIPFYENHKKATNVRITENIDPVIIFSLEDTGGRTLEYTGYKFDKNGALYELDYLIDEEYAMNNEVWVFSLNETYHQPNEPTVNNNSNKRIAQQVYNDLFIPNMIVECYKEDWANGYSEVAIITIFSDYNLQEFEEYLYGSDDENKGGLIRLYNRSDIKNQRKRSTNFFIINNWAYRVPRLPYAHYVVFEHDMWPVGTRTACYSLSRGSFCNTYRSSDSYYDSRTIDQSFQPSYSYYDRSCIRYPLDFKEII